MARAHRAAQHGRGVFARWLVCGLMRFPHGMTDLDGPQTH
jgi:hypothetical protein